MRFLELSNSGCLPGKAGGSPDFTRLRLHYLLANLTIVKNFPNGLLAILATVKRKYHAQVRTGSTAMATLDILIRDVCLGFDASAQNVEPTSVGLRTIAADATS